jgi:ATP adenylyltransferase
MRETPVNLWQKVQAQTQLALEKKALHSIPTNYQLIEQNNLHFIVRMIDNLNRKDRAKKEQKKLQKKTGKQFNPFLPYEQDLFVANLGPEHVCILNKFNVIEHHLLIITREFEPQENLISLADFTALWTVFQQLDGFGFYNAGQLAGASQPHKHLQFIPYPFAPEFKTIPIDDLVLQYRHLDQIVTIPELPYQQAIAFFANLEGKSPLEIAETSCKIYQQLLKQLGLNNDPNQQTDNYNLLITKQWMMMIPRSKPEFKSISVNSLGFAGALLVKNDSELETLIKYKPLHILAKVGVQN